jgi:hypothetical protein
MMNDDLIEPQEDCRARFSNYSSVSSQEKWFPREVIRFEKKGHDLGTGLPCQVADIILTLLIRRQASVCLVFAEQCLVKYILLSGDPDRTRD